MSKNKDKMPFNDYLDQLENDNAITVYKDDFYQKLTKDKFKKLVYRNMFNKLENIILKLYKWHLPPTFNERAIELGLLNRGYVCAFKGPLGSFCLPCAPNNRYNIYGEPSQVRVQGYNGFNQVVDIIYPYISPSGTGIQIPADAAGNIGVFMRDNDLSYPYINYVREYAYKLTDKIIALHIACQRLKSPFVYAVDEKELKDTFEKVVEKIESNDDVIIRKRNNKLGNGEDSVQVEQNTMNPNVIQAMKSAILFDFDMFLETIGINTNPSPDKAEVVLTPELESNNSLIDICKDVRFMNRQKFCEQINNILGIPCAIEMNTNDAQQLAETMRRQLAGEGGFNNDSNNQDK